MTPQPRSTTMRLRLWQQNLNKSNKAQHDLLNPLIHKDWDIILLQELYIDSFGNTRANHHWRVVYPSSHLADTSAKCSIILVKTTLDTNSWSQVRLEGTNDITVIQGTIEEVVPISKPMPHTKPWWNLDLSRMKSEKNHLSHQSYLYRAFADHPCHQEHHDITDCYAKTIQDAKTQHWEDYLADLNEDQLWDANRYISLLAGDGGKVRVLSLTTRDATGGTVLAEMNEEESKLLAQAFFPPKPSKPTTPGHTMYPTRILYKFQLGLDLFWNPRKYWCSEGTHNHQRVLTMMSQISRDIKPLLQHNSGNNLIFVPWLQSC